MIFTKYIAFCLLFVQVYCDCQSSSWVENNGKCYYFSGTNEISLAWHEALSKCESMRGNLVVIETEQENNFLTSQLEPEGHYYIGLHDLNSENVWQWVDGSPLDFVVWAGGQPDNWQTGEDCVEIVENQGGLWNDKSCSIRQRFICEADTDLDPFPNCQETEGWEKFEGRCYKVVNSFVPWTAAEADCVSMGGNLVGISSSTEQLFVANEANNWNAHVWIGLSNINSGSGDLKWSNGVDEYPGGYTNWGSGPPTPSTSVANCIKVDPGISTNGAWSTDRCGEAHPYMCETGLTGTCAPGWYLYRGNCYFQASTEQLWMTWVQAKQYCETVGASLLKIETYEEQEYINSRLLDIADGGSIDVWIGVSDSNSDGTFVWTDGTTATTSSFTYWQENQPRNRPGAWDCGQIFTGTSWGGWEVDDCFKIQAFMCEIPAGKDVKPVDPIDPGISGCDPGWIYYDEHCYYFEYNKKRTWQLAEDDCVAYDGHLVSIVTGEENGFVVSHIVAGTTWTGGHDIRGEGNFQWVDKSPWAFTNWASGEPSNNGGEGDCTTLWDATGYMWDDTSCSNQFGYVCKKITHECDQPLGMENRNILDSQITANSMWNSNHAPHQGRLNNDVSANSIGAWVPAQVAKDCSAVALDSRTDCGWGGITQGECVSLDCCWDDTQPGIWCFNKQYGFAPGGSDWIQVHLVPRRKVSAITTQGRPRDHNQYVTSYKISHSEDGINFVDVGKVFVGNTDTYTPITNRLPQQISTSYIRLYPMTWFQSPTLRMEILGCDVDGSDLATPSPDQLCTSVPVNERLDCGYPGIDGNECLSKGCCWDSTQPAIWCFYKKGDYDSRCGKDWSFDPAGEFLCYHFNDIKRRTWQQARKYCNDMGAELLSINSQHEQSYVAAQMSTRLFTNAFWIGANNLDGSTGWEWSNGQAFNYFAWRDGEPNGYESEEHCVEAYTSDGMWNDLNCATEKAIACKKFANIAPPVVSDEGNILIDICEGESSTLACTGSTVITIHHAAYGRSNAVTCGEHLVPDAGCQSLNALDIVSGMCNNLNLCTVSATNEVFGDPCHGTHKYLNIIYSCESNICYQQLGVENGTIADSQISQSSFTDSNHRGSNGRLNGPTAWTTNEGVGAWVQVSFPNKIRITGVMIQGANDADLYVTLFKIAFANDDTLTQWTDYQDFDKNVANFVGNSDTSTPVRVVMAEDVFSSGIRIYPLEWWGSQIGMRFEITGCHPIKALQCEETGDVLLAADAVVGTVIQAECPALCPGLVNDFQLYGTGIYSGNSQICNAAVHAGMIIDRLGGPVTVIKKESQSVYKGSVQNDIVSRDYDFYPQAFAFAGKEKRCEAGWIPYEGHCYWFSDYALTWGESEAICVSLGGHLASIFNQVEQDFLLQYLYKSNFTDIWIGLNDLRSFNIYEWIDGDPVTYTNWKSREPNNYNGNFENCVEMYRDTVDYKVAGTWNDALCSDVLGFVCKKYKDYYSDDQVVEPTPAPGCKEGWIAYDYMCYWFERNAMMESEAEDFCEQQGGVTVHIRDKYTQSFLHTAIGAEDKRWWIGLHAVVSTDTGVIWQWESGDTVTYENWGKGNPNVALGECVVFYGGPFGYGSWYSTTCDNLAYTICEMPREGFTPPPPTTPPPVGGCYYDWVTPDESTPYCYKVFSPTATGDYDQKQAWNYAHQQCLAYGGDLVSIHSKTEEAYLIDQLAKLSLPNDLVWIGYSNLDGADWDWSDGSPTQYVNWNIGSPSSETGANCAVLKFEAATKTGLWMNLNCAQKLDWICKINKGIEVVEPTESPTGVPDPSCGSPSQGLWLKYDGMCYLFNNDTAVDVHTAEDACNDAGGYLVSIHSNAEQSFITNQAKKIINLDRSWIGLKEHGSFNGQFSWSDNTVLDFVNWSPGEPNDGLGMEQCVEIYNSNGKWNDGNCGLKNAGYICKKYPNGPPVVVDPTPSGLGGCPSGWYMYNNYCFKLHGVIGECDPTDYNNPDCAADWKTAQARCALEGADLATIHNKYENAFLASQTIHVYNNVWIGLNAYQWNNIPFVWASGDQVIYTNWNNGEPNAVDGSEDCVEMYRTEAINGRWNDNRCGVSVPYVCSRQLNPDLSKGNEVNNNRKCKDGWMQFDTIPGEYLCYYLDETLRTFEDAQTNCRNMGGNLASLQTHWEQSFITSYVKETPAWLGMQLNPETYEWVWVDGWPVWISNWGETQPGSDYTKNCVVNRDSVLGSEWITDSCTAKYASICKTSTENIPPTPGYIEGYCQDSSWQEYGGFCYYPMVTLGDVENLGLSWNDAEAQCNINNGHLASFTSRAEVEWVLSWYNYSESFWIGLRDNGQGGWSWTDYRPVAFTYWNSGEPNDVGENGEDCVEMLGDSGRWNDLPCLNKRAYMCRVPKVIGTDENGNIIHYTTPAPTSEPIGNNNGGIIAGAVIGGLVAIALIIGIIVYCMRSEDPGISKITSSASDFSSGIVNKVYSVTGNAPSSSTTGADESGDFNTVKYDKDLETTTTDSIA